MKKLSLWVSVILIALLCTPFQNEAKAHCEIPCGIYGDSLQIALMYEHIATIERSMTMIKKLSAAEEKDYNQIVRWVMNKEEHAEKLQEIASQYFMHQRIKIVEFDSRSHTVDSKEYTHYVMMLTLMHKIQVLSMKAKQSTDAQHIVQLRETLHQFEHAYFKK